jgi:ABC-type transport system involved in cytochrome bd biosynthesis fused ATPase/permease subunit
MSAFLFWRKRDRLYLGLSLTVCVIIAAGALLTGGGH